MSGIDQDWTFKSREIADTFDHHVREQLPWYDIATGLVSHVARHYIPQGGLVYDIGASTGNISRAMEHTVVSRKATVVAIDNSIEMLEKYSGIATTALADAVDYNYEKYDFAVCFLVLMFIHPERRKKLINNLFSRLNYGGAIMVFDKCAPCGGYVSTVMSRLAMAGKLASGAKPNDIIAKELSLSGIQRPMCPSELPNAVEIFRFGDFAGWIIEREKP